MSEPLARLKPFTKWTGGKRQLLPELTARMPDQYGRYYEPFIGGGALLFETAPTKATINDMNRYLVNCYEQIRDNVDPLIELLQGHERLNSKAHYLDVRSADRDGRIEGMTKTELAARVLYMLRVDFNGLYRVNSKNQFNVPYGRHKNPKIVDEPLLRTVSQYLNEKDICILKGDFETAVNDAQAGDFVYFDPPYAPVSATSAFTAYTNDGFGSSEQMRLRDLFASLTERGVKVMLSNSDVGAIHELYKDLPHTIIEIVSAKRVINAKADGRGKVNEVIIRNYDQ